MHEQSLTQPSLNPARFVLAYKRIPYDTVWVEHADIEPTLKSMYIPPPPSP